MDYTLTKSKAVTKTTLLSGSNPEEKRAELKRYFNQTFDLYESLFNLINSDNAYYLRPEPLRHPLIFYFGHTAVFFINKLVLGKFIDKRLDENLESMFAIGVDEMSWDDLNDAHYDWPTVARTREYRNQVREIVNKLIDTMPIQLPIAQDSPAWTILMGIEHERIHVETSSVIMRMMSLEYLKKLPDSSEDLVWQSCKDSGDAPENVQVSITGKTFTLGKPESVETYGWDNEYGVKTTRVEDFEASKYLVSNAEFLTFIEAGGYHHPEYWTEEGSKWLAYSKAEMPRFWFKKGGKYFQRNLLEEIPLPLNWPVETNYLEAKAFCNWKAKTTGTFVRLPTEAEWLVLRERIPSDQQNWDKAPGNINLEYYASSCPVDRFEADGLFDIIGNVWQWTETPIDAYPGFAVHPLYDDFSTPTFDGLHNLMKGGAWVSTGNEATHHARYAFRRHFFQHAGFRYIAAKSAVVPVEPVNTYETDEVVTEFLEAHYGPLYFDVPNSPIASVKYVMEQLDGKLKNKGKVLDLGCSVGRASFELAKHFNHVDAIDFSARFIRQGFRLSETGKTRYSIATEGELVEFREVNLEELGYAKLADKIEFVQGDAHNLKDRFTGYDLVYCANLLDRLYDPKLFLSMIHERMNDGAYLALSSPYTWLTEHTPKDKWVGGIKVSGENFSTLDGLHQQLDDRFEMMAQKDIPFVIRETARKFQYNVSEMTIWRKR